MAIIIAFTRTRVFIHVDKLIVNIFITVDAASQRYWSYVDCKTLQDHFSCYCSIDLFWQVLLQYCRHIYYICELNVSEND